MSDKLNTINIRIDSETKSAFKQHCTEIGMTASQAITVFMIAFNRFQGFPFDVRIPNETTLKALNELESGKLSPASKTDMEEVFGKEIS